MKNTICKKCSMSFDILPDDFSVYEKLGVLQPKLCPECRAQLRLSFRNERVFYKRPCDKCNKSVISMYSPNKPDTVYCYDCWFADDWDALDYAREYDLTRPFFEQFAELWKVIPKIGLIHMRSVNSEYLNICADNKNCYMIVESSNNEDCSNCYWVQLSRDLADCSFTNKVERSYQVDDCYDCYGLTFSKGCYSCTESNFLLDCRGCTNCTGCINLRQKQYCLFNEQLTKEEYEKQIAELKLDTWAGQQAMKKKFYEFSLLQPRKFAEVTQATNSTGMYLSNVKNVQNCFHTYEAEDCKYCVHAWRNSKDNMDCDTVGRNSIGNYQCVNTGIDAANNLCCNLAWGGVFQKYSMMCPGSQELFGCTGLRNKKFCILNKQYSEEEYRELTQKIIESMKAEGVYGDFFPKELSPFGYNEACVEEQFPLSKEEALAQGFKWEDTPRGTYGKETKKWSEVSALKNELEELGTNAKNEIFACVECDKNYKIIEHEIALYTKLHVPFPRTCPECRHISRFIARGPNKLFDRKCANCSATFKTNYSPDKPEILYCESCYNKNFA